MYHPGSGSSEMYTRQTHPWDSGDSLYDAVSFIAAESEKQNTDNSLSLGPSSGYAENSLVYGIFL